LGSAAFRISEIRTKGLLLALRLDVGEQVGAVLSFFTPAGKIILLPFTTASSFSIHFRRCSSSQVRPEFFRASE
jgi:hypothetical protein